ncbi:hypothetical protein D3C76_1142450 [compost metagenome]
MKGDLSGFTTPTGSQSVSRRRNRRQRTNQNGQHQKTAQKNRHLRHTTSHTVNGIYCGPMTAPVTDADCAEKYGSALAAFNVDYCDGRPFTRKDLVGDIDKRREDQAAKRQVTLDILVARTELQRLRLRLRDIKCAEHTVPE